MEQVLNDPVIAHFFQSIRKQNSIQVFKQLVLLGIHSVSSKVHGTSQAPFTNSNNIISSFAQKQNIKPNTHQHQGPTDSSKANERLAEEIQKIHIKIDQLAHNFNKQQGHQNWGNANAQETRENKNWKSGFGTSTLKQSHGGNYFRHHLDDSQIRRVLTNPFATEQNKQLPKQSSHQKQKHLDQEELRRMKTQTHNFHRIQEESEEFDSESSRQEISENRGKSSKPSVSQSGKNKSKSRNKAVNARSKIKSLLEKDKLKHQSNAFSKKVKNYCQFEYSDEEEFSGQIYELEKSQKKSAQKHCVVHSYSNEEQSEQQNSNSQQSSQKTVKHQDEIKKESNDLHKSSNKKQKHNRIQRSKRSVSHSDAISQSSSFSKFSMNSKREVGKISGI